MEIKLVKVSEKGQIAIPRSIRESVGIEKGDELVIVVHKGKILLQKSEKIEKMFKNDFDDVLRHSNKSLKSVWDNKKDDEWKKLL